MSAVMTGSAAETALTPGAVERALARLGDDRAAAERLAAQLREWFGAEALRAGPDPKEDELTVAWALEVPGEDVRVRVLSDDAQFVLPLRRLGSADVHAGAITLPSGTAFRWNYEVTQGAARRRTLLPDIPEAPEARPTAMPAGMSDTIRRIRGRGRPLEVYATHPDSRQTPGVPHGELIDHLGWRSRVFAGTTRDWWVYVPAQYRPDEPACVMVFQDGARPKDYVPTVFDNLMAKGDMPVTVGVFIMPGMNDDGTANRSFEYDTLSDQYSRFLLEEILPEVERMVRLRHDPESRAIAGTSSGGICSFTVAWERPDAFHKVLSWVGSFTDIRGDTTIRP